MYDTLIILEKNEGVIEFVEEHNPHLIRIERDEFAGLVATFFNNAPSPGLSKGVAAASEFIDLINTSNDVDTPSFEDLANLVSLHHQSQGIQALWLKVAGRVFNYREDVCVGMTYINPQSSRFTSRDIASAFDVLSSELAKVSGSFKHILVLGDFNAHIGRTCEF